MNAKEKLLSTIQILANHSFSLPLAGAGTTFSRKAMHMDGRAFEMVSALDIDKKLILCYDP